MVQFQLHPVHFIIDWAVSMMFIGLSGLKKIMQKFRLVWSGYVLWMEGMSLIVWGRLFGKDHRDSQNSRNSVSFCKTKRGVIVSFVLNEREWKILIPRRGPPEASLVVLSITNQDGLDVTKQISEYMGPNSDFYQTPPTPSNLGHSRLIFSFATGQKSEFGEHDPCRIYSGAHRVS